VTPKYTTYFQPITTALVTFESRSVGGQIHDVWTQKTFKIKTNDQVRAIVKSNVNPDTNKQVLNNEFCLFDHLRTGTEILRIRPQNIKDAQEIFTQRTKTLPNSVEIGTLPQAFTQADQEKEKAALSLVRTSTAQMKEKIGKLGTPVND
jgi:hypothetical protein